MSKSHEDTPFSDSNKIGDYILEKTLGRGTFGKVKLAKHIPTGEKVAIKILKKSKIKEESDKQRVIRELKILKKVRHPNVIQLYQIIETKEWIFLIMEYAANAELYDLIIKRKRLSEKEAFDYFEQLISGIEYLHRLNIIHRDLKLENLLLTPSLKLADFGLSSLSSPSSFLQTPCGSPCYAAPEMLLNRGYIGGKVDVWSAGVVLFAMACGFLPFDEGETAVLYDKICKGIYDIPPWLSDDLAGLIRGMLKVDPTKRIGIDEIRKSSWWRKWGGGNGGGGIIIGVHEIPVDKAILGLMENSGVDTKQIEKDLSMNKFDSHTATYYLLFQKFLKNGGKSNADLKNENFRPKFIRNRSESNRKDKRSTSKEKSFVEVIQSQAKSKLIQNEENNKQIKSTSLHKLNKKPNSFSAYMNSLKANALKNKLKENSIRTNPNITIHKDNNTNTNKTTTIQTDPKNSSQIKKEKKKASKTLIDFGFVSERLEQEKLNSSKLTQKTKLKDILTHNFNSPLEKTQRKFISNRSNLNINIFNSPKMFKTILDDFRSNNSTKKGPNFIKSVDKQKSIDIINFNLKDLLKIKNNESIDRNSKNFDSAENMRNYIKNENNEKDTSDKLDNETHKFNQRYLDVMIFNDNDKIINENHMNERNGNEKMINIKKSAEKEKIIHENKFGNSSNNYDKTPNMTKKADFLNESKVSKKKSYSYDFSRKCYDKVIDSNIKRISENQNKSACKNQNGNDSKSYQQLSSMLKANNCFKKQEKDTTNPNERRKLKERDMNVNNKSLSLTKTCRSNSSNSKTSKKVETQKKHNKSILMIQQNSIFLENLTSYSSMRSQKSKFNPFFKNLLLKEILLK